MIKCPKWCHLMQLLVWGWRLRLSLKMEDGGYQTWVLISAWDLFPKQMVALWVMWEPDSDNEEEDYMEHKWQYLNIFSIVYCPLWVWQRHSAMLNWQLLTATHNLIFGARLIDWFLHSTLNLEIKKMTRNHNLPAELMYILCAWQLLEKQQLTTHSSLLYWCGIRRVFKSTFTSQQNL